MECWFTQLQAVLDWQPCSSVLRWTVDALALQGAPPSEPLCGASEPKPPLDLGTLDSLTTWHARMAAASLAAC